MEWGATRITLVQGRLTHATIPAFGIGVIPNNAGIALLEILLAGRLDDHWSLRTEALSAGAIGVGGLGRARSGWGVHDVFVVLEEP